VGLRGLVGQLYREDNAHKIRRGLVGRVRQGLSAGGAPYGYHPDPNQKGKPLIVEDEARVVRRIFDEFVSGRSPRSIAHDLNRNRIAPPRGRAWNASTINGSCQRHNGIIRNELYAGKLVWNKVRMVKDPDTGRRVSRPNPAEQWQVSDVPELAIVTQDVFAAAQARKRSGVGQRPETHRRPRRLLSGLLRCGCCGAGMSTNGKDSTGRVRIRCSAATESGTCPNPKTFYLEKIEALVLSTLTTELRHPAVITEYVRAYHEERKRLAASAIAQHSALERKRNECQREMDRLIDAIAKGIMTPEDVGTKIIEARTERDRIIKKQAEAKPIENVVALHPMALARYEQQLQALSDALQAGLSCGDGTGAQALRDLIDTVTVYRGDGPGEIRVEMAGRLNVLLGHKPPPGRLWGTVVAEERNNRSTQPRPIPFILDACA